MGIVPFDDHPSVLLQLRGVEHLEQGFGRPLDKPRLEVRGQPAFEQLHANEWHYVADAGSDMRFIVPETKRTIKVCCLSEQLLCAHEPRDS